ncbi:MAG TPA: hypothetical protein VFE26_14065, partial [Trebonia sp.]|nr:hypothetical protein [Trebonia sp.]
GATTVNGVDDFGDIVGFYTDGAGNTDGFAAVPAGQTPLLGLISATTPTAAPTPTMPTATPTTTMPATTPTTTMPATSTSPASTTSPASPNPAQPTHW